MISRNGTISPANSAQAYPRHPLGRSSSTAPTVDWLAPSHPAGKEGAYSGVPYDGQDPAFADLYHNYSGMPANFAGTAPAMGRAAPDWWKLQYFNRVKDLLDQHQPDLIITDGGIPFEEYGLNTVAEFYNVSPRDIRNAVEGVYFSKTIPDCPMGEPASSIGNAPSPRNQRMDDRCEARGRSAVAPSLQER